MAAGNRADARDFQHLRPGAPLPRIPARRSLGWVSERRRPDAAARRRPVSSELGDRHQKGP